MTTLFALLLFVINRLPLCGAVHSYDGYILASDPLYSLYKKLQDPKQIETWWVLPHPLLSICETNRRMAFPDEGWEGKYDKRNFRDLGNDKENVVEIVAHATLEHKKLNDPVSLKKIRDNLAGDSLIWTKDGLQNYLVSYQPREDPYRTFWIIGAGKRTLWDEERARGSSRNFLDHWSTWDGPPRKCHKFPLLQNPDYELFCELHRNYTTLQLEKEQFTSERLGFTSEIQKLNEEIESMKKEHESMKKASESMQENHQQTLIIGGSVLGGCMVLMIIGLFCCLRRRSDCGSCYGVVILLQFQQGVV